MPPFTTVVLKVTLAPAHILLPGVAAIVTSGTTEAVTDIITLLLVAVVGCAQVAVEVITTQTESPLFSEGGE